MKMDKVIKNIISICWWVWHFLYRCGDSVVTEKGRGIKIILTMLHLVIYVQSVAGNILVGGYTHLVRGLQCLK